MNKKILAVAIVGSLTAGVAGAVVNLNSVTANPVKYSQELVIPPADMEFINSGVDNAGQLTLSAQFGYAFSQGEVRYARVSCSNGVRFDADTSVVTNAAAGVVNVGAVNGLGTSAITFSVTAAGAGGIPANTVFFVDGDRFVDSTADASCSYSLYDTPSQAAAGTDSGRITSATSQYLDFVASYRMNVTNTTGATANVEAAPAYTAFTVAGPANLGTINTDLTAADIYRPDGDVLEFGEIIGVGSKHIVTGDFTSVVSDGTAGYDAAAIGRVRLDADRNCATTGVGDIAPTTLTATTATFDTGATPLNHALCLTAEGSPTISDADFSVVWDVVSADVRYATPDIGPVNLGSIRRNGTQLQAPMINLPQGYVSRVALTNTGTVARPFTLIALPYEGAPITTATATFNGTIPARSGTVVELKDFITAFGGTGATRAVVVVTVNGPNTQIQGQYQIVNPASGGISNYVMVRPGTN